MTLTEEIKQHFSSLRNNRIIALQSLPNEYPGWIIRKDGFYGIFILYNGDSISENFNNVKLWSDVLHFNDKEHNVLMLTSTVEYLRNEFASICSEFVSPGANGLERKHLIASPSEWWERWKSLLGNSVVDKKPYSILAEMIAYENLIDKGHDVKWGNFEGSTHDLETVSSAYEVKATTSRYDSLITVNSQFQLDKIEGNLYIILCRMEESRQGTSIDEQREILIEKGVPKSEIDNTLYKLGLEKGSSTRRRKYKVLEMREYVVDDSFPKVTLENLNPQNKEAIKKITYTLDLSLLPHEPF